VSLLLEIPFFMAAYQFLSHLSILNGISFGPIADLGKPDGMLLIGSLTVNVLPVLMTLINVISSAIYLRGFPLKTKIQLYAMALFFLVFLYTSPAGLVFYWTLNNLFSLVKTIFYKLAIVNLVSIIEAILLETANNICQHANQCKRIGKCRKHFNKDERNNVRKALEKLVLIDVLDYDEAKVQRTLDIIELRNRIHIRLATGSELRLDDFNLELYNEVILLLQDIDKQVFQKGVPLYGCTPF
jgi:hypothetical protein